MLLLYVLALAAILMWSGRYWFGIFPAYAFVSQFYMGLAVLASMLIHMVNLDAAGIVITVAIFAYYSTSRASKSYPGSYDPAFFGDPDRMRKGCTDYFGAFEIRGAKNIKHPEQQHMVAIHPHGPTAFSRMFFIGGFRELLKRPSRMIGANVLFYLPIVREITLFFGALDADKETVEMLLREGVNVELYPGAMDEMIQPGDKTINVKTRRGFLRLALQYGVDILPCFCFGETKLHDMFTAPGAEWIKRKLRIGLIWPIGRFYSFLPYKSKPQHLVIGETISVERVEDPSEEQVDALHKQYKAAIAKVFEENKRQLGHESYSLNIV